MSTSSNKRLTLVAAVARNGVIGDGPVIPWRIPGEQARFKELTWGHTLVMGRTTYESIGRPLPGRTTIVLTRSRDWRGPDGVLVAHGIDEALALAEDLPGDVMVVGGAQVYAAALPLADEQVLTEVALDPPGDVRYPDWDRAEWARTGCEHGEGDDGDADGTSYDVVTWTRRTFSGDDVENPGAAPSQQ